MDLAGFSFSPTPHPGEAAVNLLMTYLFIFKSVIEGVVLHITCGGRNVYVVEGSRLKKKTSWV